MEKNDLQFGLNNPKNAFFFEKLTCFNTLMCTDNSYIILYIASVYLQDINVSCWTQFRKKPTKTEPSSMTDGFSTSTKANTHFNNVYLLSIIISDFKEHLNCIYCFVVVN